LDAPRRSQGKIRRIRSAGEPHRAGTDVDDPFVLPGINTDVDEESAVLSPNERTSRSGGHGKDTGSGDDTKDIGLAARHP
jgi:hypothetical protein